MNSPVDVWARVLKILENNLTHTSIETFLSDAEAVEMTDTLFVIHTPVPFKKDTIVNRYADLIKAALFEIFSGEFELLVLTGNELEQYLKKEVSENKLFIDNNFTFDRFVVGNSNKFAYAAARAVADSPANSYNPLFIYGESGLGKTHLLYAIAHEIHRKNPEYNIVYIKGDDFTNELIAAIREGKNVQFRDKYRSADVFLVDDIQFISGKQQTQEEFFHTFNSLYEANRQIVLTSDRPPKEMSRLEDRLQTRFEWGLLADIQPPDYETRIAILKKKTIQMGLSLPDVIIEYIAENISSNVRQLEGSVKKIQAIQDLMDEEVDIKTTLKAIKDFFKDKTEYVPTVDIIIQEVCKYYSIEESVIKSRLKTKNVALARQVAMYLIRRLTNLPFKDIGNEFGGKDHTTVMSSVRVIEDKIKNSEAFSEVIKDIISNINSQA